jgi:hypothetical protein
VFEGLGEKLSEIFKNLFPIFWHWIYEPFKELRSFKDLIFGKDGDTDLAYGTFTLEEITDIYQPGMNSFVVLAVTSILIGIIINGMRISSAGINPSSRLHLIEFLKDLAIVAILFWNLSDLYTIIFGINYIIVGLFNDVQQATLIELGDLKPGDDVLGKLIINLCLLGLAIWANFYYLMRKLTLMMLMIMGPLMIAFYLIPQTKSITIGWFKELIGTVFIQSIHAALYWMVGLMAVTHTGLEGVILYIIFIPTAEALKSLIGLGGNMHSNLAKIGALFGGSALMGMYGAVKGALGDKTVMGAIRGAYNGVKDRTNKGNLEKEEGQSGGLGNIRALGANTGTDIGTTPRAEKMLKAGQAMSKIGKATLGMAGSIAGSPMGPMGSIMGSTVGFTLGGVAGGLAGRAGYAGANFVANRAGKFAKGFLEGTKGTLNSEKLADEKLANALADAETSRWASATKESFMEEMKQKFPDAHQSALEGLWNQKVSQKRNEFLNKARQTIGEIRKNDGKYANAQSLVQAATDHLTNNWAKANEKSFKEQFDRENPLHANASEADILTHKQRKEQAWNNAVKAQREKYSAIANNAAMQLTKGVPLGDAYINKGDFAKSVVNQAMSLDREQFKANYLKTNPNATQNEIDLAFEKEYGGQRLQFQAVQRAINGVKSGRLYNGTGVNTNYLANQLAAIKTNEAKLKFIESQRNDGVSADIALQQWNEKQGQVFASHLKEISQQMPKNVSLDRVILPQNNVIRGVGALGVGLKEGVVQATGLREISKFMADTKLGQGVQSTVGSLKTNFSLGNALTGTFTPIYDGLKGGIQQKSLQQVAVGFSSSIKGFQDTVLTPVTESISAGIQVGKNHVASNVEMKQAAFKNALAFTGGIISGVSGYQKGAKLGMKLNPYNNAVNQKIAEVSEIIHMAQSSVDEKGNLQIDKGAIQLVTTGNQSYIQVRDKTGQTQIVSRFGSGDSTLKKGEVVYQDLTVQNGALVRDSSPYKLDSGGGKILLDHQLNINPNQLVANRNTPKNPRVINEVQPFNQLVDSKEFYMDDIIAHTPQNIRMVIDRNRSYLVATDNQGNDVRISAYGAGDPRLSEDQVIYTKCEIRNRKLIRGETFTINEISNTEQVVDYTSSIDPRELIPTKPNKRLILRKEAELLRHKGLGGLS